MTAPTFGMQFSRPDTEAVPVNGADFSKVLVIETSADASNAEFPAGQAKRISSGDPDAVAALGTGLLADAVKGINAQLAGLNSGADVTVFRVAEGANAGATAAAIADVVNNLTSIPSAVNATPRIVVAGRTAWRPDLNTVNPVIAALQTALPKILAIAPVDVDDTSKANAISARNTMNSERLMPIGVAARVFEGSSIVTRSMAARVAGLIIRTDNEHSGKPFEPFANRPLYGLAGISRKVPFSLLDGSTEGQQLLEANVAIVAEGEVGLDGSIADGGFSFIGTDNATTGDLWRQMHQVRGADYIVVKIMRITRQFLGSKKITADMAEAWINSIAFMLRDHKADDDILGYTPRHEMFKASKNSPEDIRLGTLKLDIGIEPAPVFKRADHEIQRYRPALEGLVGDIVARLNAVA